MLSSAHGFSAAARVVVNAPRSAREASQARAAFDPEQLPVLGEPLPVEFANTWYSDDGTMIDFLATREMVAAWLALAPGAAALTVPSRWTAMQLAGLRDLRNAIHLLCAHAVGKDRKTPSAPITVINNAAGKALARLELNWSAEIEPTATLVHRGTPVDRLVAQLASEAITFFAGPDRELLRACATPSCSLFFVQRHHRRRFCSEPCSQRTRQSRYYRSRHPFT